MPMTQLKKGQQASIITAKRIHHGFTLIELLIAISIFAVLSAMAYSGLTTVLNTNEGIEKQAKKLTQLQRVISIIERDITQITNRPIRDTFGDVQPPIRTSSLGTARGLEFTRAGYQNPLLQARSTLRRIAYKLDDDKLVRMIWQSLDQPQNAEPIIATLLENVSNLDFRFYSNSGNLTPNWPPSSSNPDNPPPPLPQAVEVTLETNTWGEIKRIFVIGGNSL